MDEQEKKDLAQVLARISEQLERLTLALEKSNSINERRAKCPSCMGDGKAYGGHRCVQCGGSGVRQLK
jgi:DnaJ-class molecular chaperone